MKTTIFALCLVALLAAAPAMAQADFSMYVALGDSWTAGFASGSLMDWYQDRSYPAVISALEAGTTFEQPLVSEPGFGPIYELVSLAPNPEIAPVGIEPGLPVNATLPRPYNNLGIPGATLYDMIFTAGDINNLLQGNTDNAMHDLILRDGIYTALEQGIGLQPTFMTVWIGTSDVLTAVLSATPIDGVTMTPVEFFGGLYNNAIGALVTNTTADIVLINLPYPTEIPFVNSVEPFVDIPELGRWYLMADTGPLTEDDLVTLEGGRLIGEGYGLPGGPPLPDDMNVLTGQPGYVLRHDEVETINGRIDAFNAIIAEAGTTFGLPVFDANEMFHQLASGESIPNFGGATLSTDFLLGGIYSYDGVHPQNIGYALVADGLIQFINTTFGNAIPRVDMGSVLYEGDWQNPGISPAKAQEVVFSTEAFEQLYELFPPKLDKAPRIRRPNVDRPDLPGSDIRRAPIDRR
jgi:lysophospholipase L1-like esterase